MNSRSRMTPSELRGLIVAGGVALLLIGCRASQPESARTVLTAADFADPSAPAVPGETDGIDWAQTDQTVQSGPREGVADVLVLAGAPAVAATPSAATTPSAQSVDTAMRRLLVDQMVGQVNGVPVYADEFLRPMDARLRAEAQRMPRGEWLAFALKEIRAALRDQIQDELFLSDFERSVPPEARQGLLAFVERVRADILSENLGSTARANESLLAAEGVTVEDKVKDITDRQFIMESVRKAVGSRGHVPWRDVRQAYERLPEYNKPDVAVFRVLRVPTDRAAEAEAALAAGEPFEQVAARFSTWETQKQNLFEKQLEAPYAEVAFWGIAPLNEATRALTPGAQTARVDAASAAWWVKLERIDTPVVPELYDAQLAIRQRLETRRNQQEIEKYLARLMQRASLSDRELMEQRLFVIAADRYLPGGAMPPRPAPAAAADQGQSGR